MRGCLSGLALVSTHPESASQFSSKLRDAFSEWGRLRKLHPRMIGLERDAVSGSILKRKAHPALMRGLRTKAGP